MGYLTNKMPKDRKQKIVVAFDIAVILVFIWWAFNERYEYVQGYTDTLDMICSKYVIDFCPKWEQSKNMTLQDVINNMNRTGTELPNITMIYPKINSTIYCDSGNVSYCL